MASDTPRMAAAAKRAGDGSASMLALEYGAEGRKLERELSAAQSQIAALKADYNELIMGVERKWPGETRHQTALRYILETERRSDQDHGAPAMNAKQPENDRR